MIRERSNICNQLHMPAQSGSTAVLEAMRRGYTRHAYLELIQHVTDILPRKQVVRVTRERTYAKIGVRYKVEKLA